MPRNFKTYRLGLERFLTPDKGEGTTLNRLNVGESRTMCHKVGHTVIENLGTDAARAIEAGENAILGGQIPSESPEQTEMPTTLETETESGTDSHKSSSVDVDTPYAEYMAGGTRAEERLYGALKRLAAIIIYEFYGRVDEDLVQEIVTKAFGKLDSFRGESKFSTWFFSLAKNECRMALRRIRIERKIVSITTNYEEEGTGAETEESTFNRSVRTAEEQSRRLNTSVDVQMLTGNLPEEQAKVVEQWLQGWTLEEIAAESNLPVGTVRSRWRLAKEKLAMKVSNKHVAKKGAAAPENFAGGDINLDRMNLIITEAQDSTLPVETDEDLTQLDSASSKVAPQDDSDTEAADMSGNDED
jgi:RNA polymerase sigma-70 factor (ECF subfamily)